MRSRTYSYAAGTHNHPRSLYRHSHRTRFAVAERLLEADQDSRVLDYGSGDGYLLEQLLHRVPASNLVACESMEFLRAQLRERFPESPLTVVSSPEELPPASFDRIACLEVLEHLRPDDSAAVLDDLQRLLKPDGILVVSVPLEIGPSVLIKYLAARVMTRMDRWYSFTQVVRATCGLTVERDREGSFLSHRGFDHRETRRELRRRFRIEREEYSPCSWMRGVLNAQVFWRLRKRGA
jgi:SAM-dependent methyltransferase